MTRLATRCSIDAGISQETEEVYDFCIKNVHYYYFFFFILISSRGDVRLAFHAQIQLTEIFLVTLSLGRRKRRRVKWPIEYFCGVQIIYVNVIETVMGIILGILSGCYRFSLSEQYDVIESAKSVGGSEGMGGL